MCSQKISERVFSVGAIDWDRKLFDELIPLPEGTSYNSFLVRGSEKTALVDTVDPTKWETLKASLNELDVRKIDFIIANHAEQDHSGCIPHILAQHPETRVITTPKGKSMIMDLLHVEENRIQAMEDGASLSLGDCSLQFIHFPWVHWPETMLTWLNEEKTLFPCDLFGSHLATSELFATDEKKVYPTAKRYYAEIMMPFRKMIARNFSKVEALAPKLIAPSHGPVYPRPEFILDAYRDWLSDRSKNLAVVAYVSMHGSTKLMAEHLTEKLTAKGVEVKLINLTGCDLGELATALVDATTLVLGSPVVVNGAHPQALYVAALINSLAPKAKVFGLISSYGWGADKAQQQLGTLLSTYKPEILPPVLVKGQPRADDLGAIERLAGEIAVKHKGLSLTTVE